MSQFKVIALLLSLVPQIMQIVQAVEMPGNGADKAATVTEMVLAAIDLVPDDIKKQIGLDKVQAFVSKVINIAVAFLNKVGALGKSK